MSGLASHTIASMDREGLLTAEERLLLVAARVPPDLAVVRRLAAEAPLDWSRLLQLGEQHQVSLLAYRALAEAGLAECLPDAARRGLEDGRRQAAAQASWHRYWRRRVLRRLAAAGIPVIVLKGAYLAETVYPLPYLRPMVDLDLLVPRERLLAARRALAGLGYRVVEEYNYGDEHNLALGKDSQLTHAAGHGVPVEVHWDLTKGAERQTSPNLERIWRRARPWRVDGATALAMSSEDLLLHLCLHLANEFHCFERLLWLSDIDALVRRPDHRLDWPAFVQAARVDQARTVAFAALSLSRALLGTPVPEPVLDALAPAPAARWLIARVLAPATVLRGVTTMRRLMAKYLLLDNWRLRGRLIREHVLPAPLTLRGAYHLTTVPTGFQLVPAYLRHFLSVAGRFGRRLASVRRRRATGAST